MKKRKPCNKNQTRYSPINSPRLAIYSVASDTNSQRSKSSQDLKKRRLQQQRGNGKQQRRVKSDKANVFKNKTKKRDDFGSLESLFEVKRPLTLPEVHLLTWRTTSEIAEEYSSESDDFRDLKSLITNLHDSSNRVEHEPDIIFPSPSEEAQGDRRHASKCDEEIDVDVEKEIFYEDWKQQESSSSVDKSCSEMAEEEDPIAIEKEKSAPEPSVPRKEIEAEESRNDVSLSIEEIPEEDEDAQNEVAWVGEPHANQENAKPPQYPLPEGVGEGVLIKPGGHRDSIISSTALTDSQVMADMIGYDERCQIVNQEINKIKVQIAGLKDKKNITEEDTKLLKEKQASLMSKMQEFYEMTKKIQRSFSLADPSSRTFAKMFQMLPYPHTRSSEADAEDEKAKREEQKRKIPAKPDFEGGHFDIVQEFPEDKLPRAIICGSSEDRMPKIVIPESRPKKTRCLKNLTGKLSESLNMQEKLVQENAKLEGGKYKLEEALLEKDNTLDCLQRKVCGLQAEMRIVVKENTELSRQLAFRNNQQSARSQICCPTNLSEISPRSTQNQQSSYSYASSRRGEEVCGCRSCVEEQYGDSGALQSSVCVNPDGLNPHQKTYVGSPRLSGGGSREFLSTSPDLSPLMCCRGPGNAKGSVPPGRTGICPAEVEEQLATYGNNTNHLAQQLDNVQLGVRNLQIEIANVNKERQQLEQQRKLLQCTGPCAPCSCCPETPQATPSNHQPMMVPCVSGGPAAHLPLPDSPVSHAKGASTCPQQQLRDLREQYARLQEDYRNKLCEVSCLRADADKLKQDCREAKEEREIMETRLEDVQARLKSMEAERNRFQGNKEQLVEQEQALIVAKQRYREAQDELEELKSCIQDQANQLEDYRNKYLQAQEQVEEQRRQLDLMELDNARMNENVTLEIGRVKNQFQEKLAELAPLPDILKQTQAKFQEVQQMRLIAERNCEDLSRELLTCKDQMGAMASEMNVLRTENAALLNQNGSGSGRLDELEKKNSELRTENERMKNAVARAGEHEAELQQCLDKKLHEVVQLTAMLEQVREDSARQVVRTKERCDSAKAKMQEQIAEMEKHLAQCRATARAAQKDRDEIRQKMQSQINNLNDAFDQAQGRLRSLQGHVNYLNTSYTNIFSAGGQGEAPGFMSSETAGQGQGYDSCDCNY